MTPVRSQSEVGSLLRRWRERRRVTQLELALDAGISARHLSFVETGRSKPGREMLLQLPRTLELDDEQVAPLIRDSDLAPERSRIRGDVDGVFLERGERNDLKRPFMGGRQHYVSGRAVLMRPQPVHRGHAPAVAGREPREVVLRHGGDQVVADTTLVLEERGRDHRADRVSPRILRTGTTAPVTVKAGEGVDATRLKLATEHITIGHRTSIAWQAAGVALPKRSYRQDRDQRRAVFRRECPCAAPCVPPEGGCRFTRAPRAAPSHPRSRPRPSRTAFPTEVSAGPRPGRLRRCRRARGSRREPRARAARRWRSASATG